MYPDFEGKLTPNNYNLFKTTKVNLDAIIL